VQLTDSKRPTKPKNRQFPGSSYSYRTVASTKSCENLAHDQRHCRICDGIACLARVDPALGRAAPATVGQDSSGANAQLAPRHTDETSTVRRIFPNHQFVSLDLATEAGQAEKSPKAFFIAPAPVINEMQYAPALFRHLKSAVHAQPTSHGKFPAHRLRKIHLNEERLRIAVRASGCCRTGKTLLA
jgi:hypothetical protein